MINYSRGFLIEQRVHADVVNHITEPMMKAKQTALDAYLTHTAAIHAKLDPETRQHWRDRQKKAQPIRVRLFKLVASRGIEPRTRGFSVRCSTN